MVSAGQAVGYKGVQTFSQMGTGGEEIIHKVYRVDSLFMGMSSFDEFIWLLIILIGLWMGAFAMMKPLAGASIITNKISEMGNKAGTWMGKSPIWAPVIPIIDPMTGELPRSVSGVILMAHCPEVTYGDDSEAENAPYCNFEAGSVILDPWRKVRFDDYPGCHIFHYGNTRSRQK